MHTTIRIFLGSAQSPSIERFFQPGESVDYPRIDEEVEIEWSILPSHHSQSQISVYNPHRSYHRTSMSLYRMIAGVNPASFFVAPMLGHHPEETYPRFRDCFIGLEAYPQYDNHIVIYTRTGGGNRKDYEEGNEFMRSLPEFVTDFDDPHDSTYAYWIFKVPEKWQADYDLIRQNKPLYEFSQEYKNEIYRVFPRVADKLKIHLEGEQPELSA